MTEIKLSVDTLRSSGYGREIIDEIEGGVIRWNPAVGEYGRMELESWRGELIWWRDCTKPVRHVEAMLRATLGVAVQGDVLDRLGRFTPFMEQDRQDRRARRLAGQAVAPDLAVDLKRVLASVGA